MKRILLHACCGPCSIAPVRMLREEGFEITGVFINPNIHPLNEYLKRREGMAEVADKLNLPMIWRDDTYGLTSWLRSTAWREQGEVRCRLCYASRLELTHKMARQGRFDAFTSTLLYSKQQRHAVIAEVGAGVAGGSAIPFLYRDFRSGWKEGIEQSQAWGVYRQQWCGCIYSENERYARDLEGLRKR